MGRGPNNKRKGYRCEVCLYCGKCFEVELEIRRNVEGEEGRKAEDEAVEKSECSAKSSSECRPRISSFAVLKRGDDADLDATTGATPGVSSACKEFGLEDMQAVLAQKGIKPPGEA